jgi:hypothetical protein
MQYSNTSINNAGPVASRTRRGTIVAAAARAAQNSDQGILAAEAGRIAIKARVKLPESIIAPTLEEIRAAMPEHGIILSDFFKLFISRLTSAADHKEFLGTSTPLPRRTPLLS